jgi:CBS domain-containing protein
MEKQELEQFAQECKKNDKQTKKCTLRELINAFGWDRRTNNTLYTINRFLDDNSLYIEPNNYFGNCLEDHLTLKHLNLKKPIERRGNISFDKTLKTLYDPKQKVITITNDTTLEKALTIMSLNNFSQLPVTSKADTKLKKDIVGFISWKTIGEAIIKQNDFKLVKDCLSKDIKILSDNTLLLKSIDEIFGNDFILVEKENTEICGIVTMTDISKEYFKETKPFLLLEQIENKIRFLLDKKVDKEDMYTIFPNNQGKKIETLDDLNFGDYVSLLRNGHVWNKVNTYKICQKTLTDNLEEIREIRNEIMHFSPDGISDSKTLKLENMVIYLNKTIENQTI